MINIVDSKKCCGCSACSEVCPYNAIIMKPDKEGFLYPSVDKLKCINCGLCNKVCPVENANDFNFPIKSYALQILDDNILLKSQSGGAFGVLLKTVLSENGIVYGVGFDNNLVVVHKRAKNYEQAQEFHGSKYVQSNINGVFKLVKQDLLNGKKVLFSGTACQIAGLYKYLCRNYDNLITCDLICHGVPSPLLYEKYLQYLSKKYNSKVVKYQFRYYNASEGTTWDAPMVDKAVLKNGKTVSNNEYIKAFVSDCFVRPYCHNCAFAKTERIGDFTIGDLWGVYKSLQDLKYENGLSVITFNNEKALKYLKVFENNCNLIPVNLEDVKKFQPNLLKPTKPNKRRNKILKILIKKDFKTAYKTERCYYFLYTIKQRFFKRGN